MKTINIILIGLLTIYITTSCSKDGETMTEPIIRTGLVSFGTEPYYDNDSIYFSIKVLVNSEEDVINVGYSIKDNDEIIEEDTVTVIRKGATPSHPLESVLIQTHLPLEEYIGKEIMIVLDPLNAIRIEDYLAVQTIESWKRYKIEIKKAN